MNPQPRIALVSTELAPDGGGVGVYIRETATALAIAGAEVHLILPGTPETRAAIDTLDKRIETHLTTAIPQIDHAYVTAPPAATIGVALHAALLGAHTKTPFDAIEIQDLHAAGFYILHHARATPEFDATRITVRIHGPMRVHREHHQRAWLSWPDATCDWLDEECFRLADERSAPTRAMLDITREFFPSATRASQVEHVIANPFTPSAERNRDPEPARILCIGRLEGMKGQDILIDAAQTLMESRRDLVVRFAGADTSAGPTRSPMEEALRARVEPILAERFKFLGRVDPDSLHAELERATMVVCPSRWDNMPYAVVEAMSREVPVIVSDACGLPELVSHERTGLVVPRENPAALANAIERLLNDERLASSLAANARADITTRTDPAGIADDIIERSQKRVPSRDTRTDTPALDVHTISIPEHSEISRPLHESIASIDAPLTVCMRPSDTTSQGWFEVAAMALARDSSAAAAIPTQIVHPAAGQAQAIIPMGISSELLANANVAGPLFGTVFRTSDLRDALQGAGDIDNAPAWRIFRRFAIAGRSALCLPTHSVRSSATGAVHRWPIRDLNLLADLAPESAQLVRDPIRQVRIQLQHAEALLRRQRNQLKGPEEDT